MPKSKQDNPYNRYRAQAYENVANRNNGRVVDLADVVAEVLSLATATDIDALKMASARAAIEAEDALRTSPTPSSMQAPLPGWPDAADRFWRVGEGERVRVKEATADDHLKHRQNIESNEQRVVDSAREARLSYDRLVPYYTRGAKTVAEAVAMWERDRPHVMAGTN